MSTQRRGFLFAHSDGAFAPTGTRRRTRSFRLLTAGAIATLVGSVLAVVTFSTPAFAAGSITTSPSGSTTWATNVPYGQTSPAPSGPNYFTTGTATAPAGITVTSKTCPSGTGVTSTSGPGGTAGVTITGASAPAGLSVYSYGSTNTAASSTTILGQTSAITDGTYASFTITSYSGGVLCASATYSLTVQQAAFTTVGGAASGANMYFYDDSYNQSNGQTVDAVDADTSTLGDFTVSGPAGTSFGCYNPNIPTDVAPNTDIYPNTPTPATAYDHECNLQAAPGGSDDSGVVGAAAFAAITPVTITETDAAGTNTSGNYNVNVYNPPICGVAPDGTGSLANTTDVTYTTNGDPTDAEACYDGASGPASALLTGIATAGGTIFTGSNPIDAGGGTALTIMAGPGFNWTGGAGSGEADVDTGTAGLSKQTWSGATTSSPPPSTLSSTSTVASEASFKSSGDPLNTCPPPPAMINAGMPYCLEEFETTGAGPSAAQAALEYTGQSVPTSKTPTVALSTNTANLGASINITDASGACPSTIGTGSTNFFNGAYSCWYGRAGDPTPVTVTVGGVPATVNPTSPATADVSAGNYTVNGPSDTSTYDGAGTVTLMNVTGGQNTVTTSVTSAGTATAPYNDLVGDGVSGTDIPVGTEVTNAVNNGNGTWTFTLTNNSTATPAAETLTFYAVTLTPPQLNATFSVPATAPAGPDTVQVCEPTAPNNGNDWEFGVQWMTPAGSLSDIGGGPATQVCSTSTIDVTGVGSSTTTTPTNSSITLGGSNTDGATITGIGGGADPTGFVDFYECGPTGSPTPCTSNSWTQFDTESLSGSNNPDTVTSASFTPDATGSWCFAAVYSGDSNYTGSNDETTDECFTVNSTGSSTTSSPTSSSISLGGSNADNATVTGSDPSVDPTGTVTFYECGPTGSPTPCTSNSWTQFDTESLSGSNNPDTVTSASFTPDDTGTWCFAAVYSGDSNFSGSNDETTDECFTVNVTGSSTTSSPTSSSISLGGSNTDGATVTGSDPSIDPTGSVEFYECGPTGSPTPCTSNSWTQFDTESLSGSNNPDTVTSASFTPDAAGTWCFAAVYSGDGNYGGSSDQSDGECFTVNEVGSTSVSTPTSSTAALDGPNSDSLLITGDDVANNAPYPTGTVTFYTCPEGVDPCTSANWTQLGSPATLGTSNGNTNTATSSNFTNDSVGTWCFAAVYSGDSNYTGSNDSTSDECYTVAQTSTTTISKPLNSTITQSQSNIDQVTVYGNDYDSSPPAPTGTVTFYQCGPTTSPTSCATGTQVGSPINLTSAGGNEATASSAAFTPNASPTSIGYWCFRAVYSGDGNYFSSSDDSSVDECFYVTGPVVVTSSSPLPSGTKGSHYSEQLTAAGGTAPYTWTKRGSLPHGVHLTHGGLLTGTPTQSGTYTITAKVKDSTHPHKETATKSLTVTFNP